MLQQLRHNTSVSRLLYATDKQWPPTPTSYHIITTVVAMSLYDTVMAAASFVRTCTNLNMPQSSTSSPTAWRPICTLVPVLPTRVHPQLVSHIRFHNSWMYVRMSHVTTSTLTTPSWLHCATHGTICPSAQGAWYTWIILEHTLRCKKPRWEVWTVWSVCVAQKSDRGTHVCNTLGHATITGLQTQNGCTTPGYILLCTVT